jgi:cell division protein FtsL
MLIISISLNIFLLGAALVVVFIVGYLFRSRQLTSLQRKINELEREMLNNHAEILELEKQKAELIRKYNLKVKS